MDNPRRTVGFRSFVLTGDEPNRRRHYITRAGTVFLGAGTIFLAPAYYYGHSTRACAGCQSVGVIFLLTVMCTHVPISDQAAPYAPREVCMNSIVVAEPNSGEAATGSPLLSQLWHAARMRGDSQPTADGLVDWARRFILFHNKRHPSQLGRRDVIHFLEHVVKTVPEPLPALAKARSALSLLYGDVLGIELGILPWPRPPRVLDQLRLLLRDDDLHPRGAEGAGRCDQSA
jgi:hypothetical protein